MEFINEVFGKRVYCANHLKSVGSPFHPCSKDVQRQTLGKLVNHRENMLWNQIITVNQNHLSKIKKGKKGKKKKINQNPREEEIKKEKFKRSPGILRHFLMVET